MRSKCEEVGSDSFEDNDFIDDDYLINDDDVGKTWIAPFLDLESHRVFAIFQHLYKWLL